MFRNKYSEITATKTVMVDLAAGQTAVTVPVDVGPTHGRNYCEVVVADEQGRSLTWGTAQFKADLPKYIDRVTLISTSYPVGSPIIGQVFFMGPSVAKSFHVVMELRDLGDRLLDKVDIAHAYTYPGMNMQTFILSTERCVSEGATLTVRLTSGAGGPTWDVHKQTVVLSRPFDSDGFYLAGWCGRWSGYYLKKLRIKRLAEVGFNMANACALESTYGIPEEIALWRERGWRVQSNYTIRPSNRNREAMSRYKETKDKGALVRVPCFSNPDYIDKSRRSYTAAATQAVQYGGALNYGAGDEVALGSHLCCCPHCMKNYRQLLKSEYASLEDLNAEWGTQHKSFDEIFPDTLAEANAKGNYASWSLWRVSMEASLVRFFEIMRDTVQGIDPGKTLHMSGTLGDSVDYGVDFWKLSKVIDFKGYNEWWRAGDLLRSFQTTINQPYSYSWGHMWYDFLQGAYDGYGSWCMSQLELLPDLTLSGSGWGKSRFLNELVRPGLVRFAKRSVRDNTRVAMHYSRLSRFAAKAMDPEKGEHPYWEYNVESWNWILNTFGFQPDMVTYHELESGELSTDNYDLLVLATSYAVTPGEAEAIEKFVSEGGVVIADGRLGELNNHVAPYAKRPLDELFGVIPSDKPASAEVTLAPWNAKVEILDTALKANGATTFIASGGKPMPIGFVNQVGKGKAIYLNFKIDPYHEKDSEWPSDLAYGTWYLTKLGGAAGEAAEDLRLKGQHDLVASILQEAGKQAKITARYADGEVLLSKLARYDIGRASMLGMVVCSRGGKDVEIALDGKYHVRDLLAGRDLGLTNKITTSLQVGQEMPGGVYFVTHTRLYALLPAKTDAPKLEMPAAAGPGEKVTYSVGLSGSAVKGASSVHVTVFDPAGKPMTHYGKSMLVEYAGKPGEGEIRLALDDARGQWKIVATDMLSGEQTEKVLTVK